MARRDAAATHALDQVSPEVEHSDHLRPRKSPLVGSDHNKPIDIRIQSASYKRRLTARGGAPVFARSANTRLLVNVTHVRESAAICAVLSVDPSFHQDDLKLG